LRGFGAVTAACFTSGLAGVYFEMVLKGSKTDLWVRNVQLSLFSIIPAILPIIYSASSPGSRGVFGDLLKNFGFWAWATVSIQVFGGLVTAVVIKYSDNILKGFATSLSIILSFLASVALFDFRISSTFLLGSSTVLVATWMYNQPATKETVTSLSREKESHILGSPVGRNDPILGLPAEKPSIRKSLSFGSSTQSLSSFFGLTPSEKSEKSEDEAMLMGGGGVRTYLHASFGNSPHTSRSPSPPSSEPTTPNSSNANLGQWRI